MKPIYEQEWFIKTVTWLNDNWPWWKKQIWGYSINMEDFVRNPSEELRDNCFPFCFKDVNPKSLLLRIGFIPYIDDFAHKREYAKYSSVPGTYRIHYDFLAKIKTWKKDIYRNSDIGYGKWKTKYPNATFMFQAIISWKCGFIPILFLACNFRTSALEYWQFGIGWGPQWANYNGRHPEDEGKINAVLCGKFRHADYSSESAWNPDSEVYGYFEGDV